MELAARDVQQIARPGGDFRRDPALVRIQVVLRLVGEHRMVDRVVDPPFVEAPALFALEKQGEHLVLVVMRVEGLAILPRTIEIAIGAPAEGFLEDTGDGAKPGRQRFDLVADQRGAAPGEFADLGGDGLPGVLLVAVDGAGAIELRRHVAAVQLHLERRRGPDSRHVEQLGKSVPRQDGRKLVGAARNMQGLAAIDFGHEGLRRDRIQQFGERL